MSGKRNVAECRAERSASKMRAGDLLIHKSLKINKKTY